LLAGLGGIILLAAFYLGSLFNGFGLGPGGGDGDGDGEGTGTNESAPDEPQRAMPDAPPVPDETEQPEDDGLPGGEMTVVNLLIDGEEFKLLREPDARWIDPKNYRPIELDRVVALAKDVPGDLGVKVRVAMRGNAQPEAEEQLKTALAEAGLDPTAIDWRDVTVP
jgi:hypothetical protein